MKKLLYIFLFIAAISCKKDKDKDPHQTNLDLITSRPWTIVFRGYDTNEDGTLEMNGYTENFLADCQFDDTYKFDKNETYAMQPNTNTNGCGFGSYTSSWKLHTNSVDFNFDVNAGVVVTLTDSLFHFKLIEEDGEENHVIFER